MSDECTCCTGGLSAVVSVFSTYMTPKMVRIRDWRLALLHNLFLLAGFGYVVLYQVVYKVGYMKTFPPVGTVTFQLMRPTMNSTQDWLNMDDWQRMQTPGAFRPVSDLKYCTLSDGTSRGVVRTLPCRYLDEDFVGLAFGSSLFITSRVSETEERGTIRPTAGGQPIPALSSAANYTRKYFAADVERYSVILSHFARASNINTDVSCDSRHSDVERVFSMADGSVVRLGERAGFSATNTFDVLGLDFLLAAAGIDLDARRVGPFSDHTTARYAGIQLILEIEYSNARPWTLAFSTPPARFTYSVRKGGLYTTTKTRRLEGSSRLVENRHGIVLTVFQTGELGEFDFITLLIQLTTSFTLLAAAHFAVDRIGMFCIRERKYFTTAKYDTTQPFNELRDFLRFRREHGMAEDPEDIQQLQELYDEYLSLRRSRTHLTRRQRYVHEQEQIRALTRAETGAASVAEGTSGAAARTARSGSSVAELARMRRGARPTSAGRSRSSLKAPLLS